MRRRSLVVIFTDGWVDLQEQEKVFDALDEIGYDGYYNMELNLRYFGDEYMVETAEFAVKMLQSFLDRRYTATQPKV